MLGVPVAVQWVKNPTSIHEDVGSIPGLTRWVKGSGIAAAVARIQSLAQEFSYAAGAAIKKKKVFVPIRYFSNFISQRLSLCVWEHTSKFF